MELTQLRYFQVAANYEHISRAAEALNISQPALSTMITRLEKELNVPLFDHNGRSIVLNENGRRFLKRVNHILTEVDSSKRELQEMANEHDNTISLAVSSSQFLQGMHTFMYQHLDYKWHQRVADNKEIVSLLNLGQIDMAVTSPGIYGNDYHSILLSNDEFKLAVHKDNPLARKKSVRLRDIQDERFIPGRFKISGGIRLAIARERSIIVGEAMCGRKCLDTGGQDGRKKGGSHHRRVPGNRQGHCAENGGGGLGYRVQLSQP